MLPVNDARLGRTIDRSCRRRDLSSFSSVHSSSYVLVSDSRHVDVPFHARPTRLEIIDKWQRIDEGVSIAGEVTNFCEIVVVFADADA